MKKYTKLLKGILVTSIAGLFLLGTTFYTSSNQNDVQQDLYANTTPTINNNDNNGQISVTLGFPMNVESVQEEKNGAWIPISNTSNSIEIKADDNTITKNLMFNINFSLFDDNSPLDDYYLGDWPLLFDATLLPDNIATKPTNSQIVEQNSLFKWYYAQADNPGNGNNDNFYFGPFWRYRWTTYNPCQNISRENKFGHSSEIPHTFSINSVNPDIDSGFYGYCTASFWFGIIEDYIYMWAKPSTYHVEDNFKCTIKYPIKLEAHDGKGMEWSCAYEKITWAPANYFATTKLHYTLYDLNLWKEFFEKNICQEIRLEDVEDPIIFSKYDENANEQKVKSIIADRVIKWYQNGSEILNKIGYVADYDKNGKYINKTDAIQSIYIDIPDNIRGKSGHLQTNVVVKLKEGRKFVWDYSTNGEPQAATNTYSFPIDITAIIDPTLNVNIDKLVHIDPYISPSSVYDSKLVEKKLSIKLTDNNYHLTTLHNFNVDINAPKPNGELSIIPREKISSIGKIGTDIRLTLSFLVGNKTIYKDITFKGIFNNGVIYQTISFTPDEFNDSGIQMISPMTLGLKISKEKIYLFNDEPINVIPRDTTVPFKSEINLSVTQANVLIPLDQKVVTSKWTQLEQSKFINSDDDNFEFVGTYQTYDPFIFTLDNSMKEVPGSLPGTKPMLVTKYKPYIRPGNWDSNTGTIPENSDKDFPIFPSYSENDCPSQFRSDLGTYIMENKQPDTDFEFSIVIKEYENTPDSKPDDNKYTKVRWLLNVKVSLSSKKAEFNMSGYKGNKIIEEENKNKYFNKESPEYRGDYVDEKTGMYLPKVVWVHARPPESFPYDPLDASGKLITSKKPSADEVSNFDIGYMAELNATGFAANDYKSIATFGGYETNFDQTIFTPNGVTPYQEGYIFGADDQVSVFHSPLSQSGLQTVNKTTFNQVVLRRSNSNSYLYQFVKINTRDEILASKGDIINLYKGHLGLGDQPLFEDFFESYHGKNFVKYLMGKSEKLKDVESIKALSYAELVQYWNIYANSSEFYEQPSATNIGQYDISRLSFDQIDLKDNNLVSLKEKVIAAIGDALKNKIIEAGWMPSNTKFVYGRDFIIQLNDDLFNQKLEELQAQYAVPLSQAHAIDFNVSIRASAFKDKMVQLYGSNVIPIFNNKNIDNIIDLSQYNPGIIKLNSNRGIFSDLRRSEKIDKIQSIITGRIEEFVNKLFLQNELDEIKEYSPQLGVDYSISAYMYMDSLNTEIYEYPSLKDGVSKCLMYQTDSFNFDNTLYIRINAINKVPHYIKNSCVLSVNNSSYNDSLSIIDAFNLANVKAGILKINTASKDFPVDKDKQLALKVFEIIYEDILKDINFFAGSWMSMNDITFDIHDINIQAIKSIDGNNITYYSDPLVAIKEVLLKDVDTGIFDNTLKFDVCAPKSDSNYKTFGHFIKEVNNNYLNKAIESETNENIDIDHSGGDIDEENSKLPHLSNEKGEGDKVNLVWIITPITIFVVALVTTIVIYTVRKNRKIR